MKRDTEAWLTYAEENLASSELLLNSQLFNPCLQNAQQSVEKFLKAILIEHGAALLKTHSIRELSIRLAEYEIASPLSEDDIDLLDSIYLPSKYPLASVLPHYMPDRAVCLHCIEIAKATKRSVLQHLGLS